MRQPAIFLPHGGGPWPFVDLGMDPAEVASLAGYLRGLPAGLPARPDAILVVTAHWEAPVPTVSTSAAPPMLYDYYGFPPKAYTLRWPAPGAPTVAARVRVLLGAAGIRSDEDAVRGYDHGTFIPMMVAWPEADVPCVQLSLKAGLDPAAHLAIGRALAPLRDESVLLLGSGLSYHNLRSFWDASATQDAEAFDTWLAGVIPLDAPARDAALTAWSQAPSARRCHPREEHLLPLMVVAGAAGDDVGESDWTGTMMRKRIRSARFG